MKLKGLVLLCFVGFAAADVPHLISYQGRLTDASGNPLTGTHNITFRIYDAASGGTMLWSETHTVELNSEGLYDVMLGSINPFPASVDFSQPYWLAISVDGGAELCRYQLGAAPYALNIADTVSQVGGYFFTDGTRKVFMTQGGLSLPSGETFSTTRDAVAVYGYGSDDVGVYGRSDYWEGIVGYSTADDGIQGITSSSSYAGVHAINSSVTSPAEAFLAYNGFSVYAPGDAYVGKTLQFGTLSSAPSVGEGKVYYDATDHTLYLWNGAEWKDLAASGGGGIGGSGSTNYIPIWTSDSTLGNSIIRKVGNSIAVGSYDPDSALLGVKSTDNFSHAIQGYISSTPDGSEWTNIYTGSAIFGDCSSGGKYSAGVLGTVHYYSSADSNNAGVVGAIGGKDIFGGLAYMIDTTEIYAGYFRGQVKAEGEVNNNATHPEKSGVGIFINSVTTDDAFGIYSACNNTPFYGIGGHFEGGYKGIEAEATLPGTGSRIGAYGEASGGTLFNAGVYGYAKGDSGALYGVYGEVWGGGSGVKYAIYGDASGTSGALAGYFNGDVNITGSLSKGSGSFLIDHPDDPLHKTLRHNFVESPENLCLYRGRAHLDENGTATVRMPDYFKSLTKEDEASINLTPVGKPFLVGAEWNEDFSAFTIYGEPNRDVWWTVYADRDDPVIHQLAKPVVQHKGKDIWIPDGKLLYPRAYGFPDSMGMDYHPDEKKTEE